MSIFNLGARILNKKLDERARAAAPKPDRADANLPFDARIGSLLSVPRASFALLDGTLLSVPESAQMEVTAASRLRLDADADISIHRLYTNCGAGRKGEGENFLQVMGTADEITDVAYYQFLCRIVPQSADEQAAYKGNGYGLGETDYWMAEDVLTLGGLTKEKIKALLGDTDALHFIRDTPGGDYVAPITCRETRIDDAHGEKGLLQRMWFMPYTRTLPDGNLERMLVSYEAVESFDGTQKPQVHVDIMVGLTLDRQQIKVI